MIAANLHRLEERIANACRAVGRDRSTVKLLPVSKTVSSVKIAQAAECGYQRFGESRSQEAARKATDLAALDLSWTMIGHLQTNKVKDVIGWADEFQALDSQRLAQALDRRLQAAGRGLRVYLEVNTSGEDSKFGLSPDALLALAPKLAAYQSLQPVGLMTIAIPAGPVAECFAQLAQLRDQVQDRTGQPWPELSMGMSNDFELAIAHGSTCVRVGTAIFGDRPLG